MSNSSALADKPDKPPVAPAAASTFRFTHRMQTQWPLFVFGTLRRGHENHHYLAGHYVATLRHCDELEGIPEGALAGPDYRRVLLEVEAAGGPRLSWAYVHPET